MTPLAVARCLDQGAANPWTFPGTRSFHTWLRDEGIAATVLELPADARSPHMAAFISTQLTTGARSSETLAPTPARLSVGGRITTTITGKGGRVRTAMMPRSRSSA